MSAEHSHLRVTVRYHGHARVKGSLVSPVPIKACFDERFLVYLLPPANPRLKPKERGSGQNNPPAAFSVAARAGRSLMTAPRSVSHFTFGRRKICEPHLAKMRDENASHRMDQPRRPGRAWPALVGCRDVQIGPHAQRGNQLGLDAVRMALAGPPALRPATTMAL